MFVEKLIDYGRSFYSLLGERRKGQRLDFNCTVTVSCKNRYGQLTAHTCQCVNVSDSGIGIESPDRIPDNSDIYIHSETHNLKKFARVLYCHRRGDRTYLGCSFQPAPEYWN
jgi:hypothetical protein